MKKVMMFAVLVLFCTAASLAGGGKKCSGSAAKAAKHASCDTEVQACLQKMAVKYSHRAWLGVELNKSEKGNEVTRVVPGSPAMAAGFQEGDFIFAINGVALSSDKDAISKMKRSLAAGSQATYGVVRNGQKTKLVATLGNPPADVVAGWLGSHVMENHLADETEVAAN